MRKEEERTKQVIVEWVYDNEGFLVKREIELDSRRSDTK
jgi:hypothetical protein